MNRRHGDDGSTPAKGILAVRQTIHRLVALRVLRHEVVVVMEEDGLLHRSAGHEIRRDHDVGEDLAVIELVEVEALALESG